MNNPKYKIIDYKCVGEKQYVIFNDLNNNITLNLKQNNLFENNIKEKNLY